jgi:Domain of unknown function (DUF5103)
MRSIISLALMLVSIFVYGQKQLEFSDKSYEDEIRTVMLYPSVGGSRNNLRSAVAPIENQNLVLEFDDLQAERSNYYVKLINCNVDWSKSSLMDLDFLSDYNEFPITEYDLSSNVSIPYVHYYFQLPAVKLPGNYLLVVYRESDENDILLTRRFMIYSNEAAIFQDNLLQGQGTLYASNQQLNFKVNYSRLDIINPMETVHAVIRQNQRWDNVRLNVKPSFIREDKRELEYRFFDPDNQFMAGNEFRFVDFRSLNYPGQNTGRIDRSKRPFDLWVQTDKSREDQAYAIYSDLNGNFVIENQDYRDAALSGDYVFVTFALAVSPVNGSVYLLGAMNNWSHSAESKMSFRKDRNVYETTLLLKQGLYNYQYWVESDKKNGYQIEGSHYQTENIYEIFIYYRPFRPNADLLIGYYPIQVNPH